MHSPDPRHAWLLRSAASLALLGLLLLGVPADAQAQESSQGYIEMPESPDGTWVLTSRTGSGRNWGTPTFVRWLVMVAEEWKRRHPEGPFLRIGDMSKPDGTDFPPHKTHRDGLTADLFTSPRNICHVNWEDQELTLELAELMADLGARQILYNGDLVCEHVAVAQPWPQHDDHFHVVIDPNRVPAEGAVLVLASAGLRSGDTVGSSHVDEDGAGLELAWRIVGSPRLQHYRVLFDDTDDSNGVLHDSDELRAARSTYEVPVALTHGATYRWRVQFETREGETLELPWQTIRCDLEPPSVEAAGPDEAQELDGNPVLSWRYAKSVPQATYRIELDQDARHQRLLGTLGPFDGAATSHALSDVRLRSRRTYYWRVVVTDAHGNEGASEWRSFLTSRDYDHERIVGRDQGGASSGSGDGRTGRVTASALNMRQGPGTNNAVVRALPQGTQLRVLGEQSGWLEVEATVDGQSVRGWVSAGYVDLD
jgi:Bacterial SH3 domain/Penicillin-insensitive murein endopeptidase